jgi:AcrR family transcriptional regulator
VSIRTLYRYFATREDLFEAAGDRIVARLGLPRDIPTADDITPVFLKSAELGARNLRLARSLLSTPLGRRARSPHRRRRVESITAALAEVTAHLPAAEARRRAGAITHLASMAAWVTVSEESGLSAEDARLGIAWALDVLIGHLREETRNEAVSRSRRRR